MDALLDLLPFQSLEELIRWGGYGVLVAIVFAETGLLIGAFLPGDSLLIATGMVCAAGHLDLWTVMALLSIAAIAGDSVGYWFGAKTGPRLFNRPNSRFFRREHLLKTQEFYERYGGFTIVIARFMPFARTFAPICAGIAQMEYRRFLAFNICGGLLWVCGVSALGFFLGSIPGIEGQLHLVIAVVIFLSVLPGIIHIGRARLAARHAAVTPPPASEAPEKA